MNKEKKETKIIMKFCLFFTGICIVVNLLSCTTTNSPEDREPSPIAYDSYDGYSYKGPKAQSDTTMLFYITSKIEFDSLFYFIFDHNTSDTIPTVDFSSKKILAIVKYGNDYYRLKVIGAGILDGILNLEYTCTLVSENITWVAAIPLIITVETDFHKIRFIENGTQIKELADLIALDDSL